MHTGNPACYECPKTTSGVHVWRITDGVARCERCKLVLSKADTRDLTT